MICWRSIFELWVHSNKWREANSYALFTTTSELLTVTVTVTESALIAIRIHFIIIAEGPERIPCSFESRESRNGQRLGDV
jgi:hypothetical protein